MKRIKDFIYDHNDILVALLIIAVAAFVIYGRMNEILDYPSKIAVLAGETGTAIGDSGTNPGTPSGGEDVEPAGPSTDAEPVTPPSGGEDVEPAGPGTDVEPVTPPVGGEDEEPDGPGKDPEPVTPPAVTYADFTISEGEYSGWKPLAEGLKNAGFITDANALYMRVLQRIGEDESAGKEANYNFFVATYSLPLGADYDTLIEILRVYPVR